MYNYARSSHNTLIYKEHPLWQRPQVLAPTCHRWQEASPCVIISQDTDINAYAIDVLVVQELLSRLGGVLGVRRLNNGIDWATLLAETAVDALGHIDIVSGCSSAAVLTLLSFNGDSLSWADLDTSVSPRPSYA
jgi:hypothetical protein